MRYKFLCLLFLIAACSKKESDERSPEQTPNYKVVKSNDGKVYHTGLLPKTAEQKRHLGETRVHLAGCDNLPDSFDLRTLGLVSPIRDQGQCGSCWTFSMIGSLESALLGAGKGQFDLSEQELVSCDKGNIGCSGGNLNGFDYLIKHGISLEKDYPYTASDSRCKSNVPVAAKGSSFMYVGSESKGPTEDELKCALFKYHTVPWITADASDWGNPPSSEDKMFTSCGSRQTNHAIGVVGWKKINGKTGFIMKNSWGTNWGDKGYMTLPLGCSAFGEEVAFIQVDAPAPTPTPPGPSPSPTPPGPTPPNPTPTPPGPCVLPLFKLPSSVQIEKGAEVMVGVKPQPAVYYVWMAAGLQVGEGSILYASPEQDTVYKLSGTNSCGVVESSVLVKVSATK